MSTPATDQTNLQTATLGALEWSYDEGKSTLSGNIWSVPKIKSKSTGAVDLFKRTAAHIICRVQRDPNTRSPSQLIRDAGPIWLVTVYSIPKPADDDDAPYTRDFNAGGGGTGSFDDWLMGDGTPPDKTKLNSKRARTVRCWTFEEAVEAGARLASELTDS